MNQIWQIKKLEEDEIEKKIKFHKIFQIKQIAIKKIWIKFEEKIIKGLLWEYASSNKKIEEKRENKIKNKKVIDIKIELAALEVVVWPSKDVICVTQTMQPPTTHVTYALIIFLNNIYIFSITKLPLYQQDNNKKNWIKIQKCNWT